MSLTRHVRADVRSAATTRTLRIALPALTLLAALVTAGLVTTSGTGNAAVDVRMPWGQAETLVDPITGLLLAVVLAALWGAAHRDGEILWHYLADTRRWRVAASAVLVASLVGACAAILTAGAKILTLHGTLPAAVEPAWWHSDHGTWALAGALLAAVTLAIVATCAAFLVRNAAGAIGGVLGWILVLEPLVATLLPRDVRMWLPGHALSAVRDHVDQVPTGQALAISLGYTLVLVAVTLVVVQRRDPA
ncbi:hypothetical protein ACTVCO_07505 [Sanguibacter sp. A247]|uniref:hypothetical protein n=1 Tax=unclassified Sanguibacter TaxID=2645534 RepID=UPI003FD8322C